MKLNLPKIQNLADVRKYLMVIESLELNKLNNAISVNAKTHSQMKGIQDLKSMKNYYGELTEFLIKKQTESRLDEFEACFVQQMEEFLNFWQKTMEEFRQLSDSEIERAIEKNEELKKELNEMLEQTLGFKAPPNALFNHLLAIRKIAAKLKNNEATQFLNFDYFKKHNIKINADWVRDRKLLIMTKLDHFEKKLESCLANIKDKLNSELWKLHAKRLKQFDKLMTKYNKIKQNVEGMNSKEIIELRKLKHFFLLKHSVPLYYHHNEFFLNGIQENGKTKPIESNDDHMFDFDFNVEDSGEDNDKNGKGKGVKGAKGRLGKGSKDGKGGKDGKDGKGGKDGKDGKGVKGGKDGKGNVGGKDGKGVQGANGDKQGKGLQSGKDGNNDGNNGNNKNGKTPNKTGKNGMVNGENEVNAFGKGSNQKDHLKSGNLGNNKGGKSGNGKGGKGAKDDMNLQNEINANYGGHGFNLKSSQFDPTKTRMSTASRSSSHEGCKDSYKKFEKYTKGMKPVNVPKSGLKAV